MNSLMIARRTPISAYELTNDSMQDVNNRMKEMTGPTCIIYPNNPPSQTSLLSSQDKVDLDVLSSIKFELDGKLQDQKLALERTEHVANTLQAVVRTLEGDLEHEREASEPQPQP